MNSSALHDYVVDHFRYNASMDLNQTFKFSFVRHPYDRIVSAYEDKLHGKNISFDHYLLHIIYEVRHRERDGKSINVHIRPFYKRCEYCQVNYDYIGRMETFKEDVEEILKRANLTRFIPLEDASLRTHSSKNLNESQSRGLDSHGAIKSSLHAQRYFAKVPAKIMEKINQIYSIDFAMFHYSYDGFLKS